MRLSQKPSSALELTAATLGLRGDGFLCAPAGASPSGGVLGNSSDIVVAKSQRPEGSPLATASPGVAPICKLTLITSASSLQSMLRENRPIPSTSPALKTAY